MKKGFTLIEMLGIIAVLAVVLLVTFPVLNNSLKTMKENQNENLIKNLKISAEAYIELNRKNYPELDNSGSATITIQDLYDAELLKGNYQVNTSNQIIITKKEDNTLEYYYVDPTKTIVYNFDYTGSAQEFNALQDGLYKIETWGAQGGNNRAVSHSFGGYGGYSNGIVTLNKNSKIYLQVGQKGKNGKSSPYNGGGYGDFSGGGASSITLANRGALSAFAEYRNEIIMVAGGGGGDDTLGQGGHGGGFKGTQSYIIQTGISNPNNKIAYGGTQTEGGLGYENGSFGRGGGYYDYYSAGNTDLGGSGGGGYYGGGSGLTPSWSSGAGGSGYIGNTLLTNKSMYCYDCEESNEVSTFTVSTTGTSSLKDTTNCPDGYSESPVAKCAKAGNGYARITYLGSAM